MAGRVAKAPRTVAGPAQVDVDDPKVQRAIDALRNLVEANARRSRAALRVDLVVGTNKVPHGLGRAVEGYSLTPTVASVAFAHALDEDNPRPDLEVWIEVIGVAQPRARIEVW